MGIKSALMSIFPFKKRSIRLTFACASSSERLTSGSLFADKDTKSWKDRYLLFSLNTLKMALSIGFLVEMVSFGSLFK